MARNKSGTLSDAPATTLSGALKTGANSATDAPVKTTKRRAAQAKLAAGAKELQNVVHEECKPKRGQPTKFTQEKWERILTAVATYQDLIEICGEPDMPAVETIYKWMRDNPELKDDMRGAWEMFSMIGHSVNKNILRGGRLSSKDVRRDIEMANDNRWHMSKTNRRDFGDRQTVDLNQTVSVSIPVWATALPTQSEDGEIIDADAIYEAETVKRLTQRDDKQKPD